MPVPQSVVEDSSSQQQSTSWADRMEDLEASKITPDNLPEPVTTIEGDKKTIVSYKLDEGKIKKVTRVYRIERHRVPKAVAQRKKWVKFGDVAGEGEGPNRANTQIADEVFLTLTTNREELEQRDDDPLKKLKEQQKGMVTCRICKGDHWTTKCPYKDTLGPTTIKELEESAKPKPADTAAAVVASGVPGRPAGGATGGKYVPPNQRGGPEGRRGDAMGSRFNARDDDQCTVRVTNLSEDAQEGDIRDLFSHFGYIKRIFLAKDKITQHSKGFAFVSYSRREDAAEAIKTLDGYGYDHLILKVEWAKPSKPH